MNKEVIFIYHRVKNILKYPYKTKEKKITFTNKKFKWNKITIEGQLVYIKLKLTRFFKTQLVMKN